MELVAEKYKQTDIGLIPKDWKVKQLKDIAEFSNGKAHEQFIDENGDYIVVNSKFISSEGEVFKSANVSLSPLKSSDITMVMSDIPNGKALAKCFLIRQNNKYTLNQRICSIKSEECDNDFLYWILNRNRYFLAFDSGTGQTNLKRQEILDCPLALPPTKAEQTAIATALNDVDSLIKSLSKLIEKKGAIKLGAMQQLLKPKEGWVVKPLDELADVIDPHPSHRAPVEVSNGVPFLGIGDFNENGQIIKDTYRVVPSKIFEEHQNRYNLNDELLGLGRVASIGKVIKFRNDIGKFTISPTMGVLKPNRAKREYLFQILKSQYATQYFSKIMSGSTRSSVGMVVLRKIPIPIPNDEAEQNKIATILNDMDNEIQYIKQNLFKYQLLKQGMMKELLTGKTRLI